VEKQIKRVSRGKSQKSVDFDWLLTKRKGEGSKDRGDLKEKVKGDYIRGIRRRKLLLSVRQVTAAEKNRADW